MPQPPSRGGHVGSLLPTVHASDDLGCRYLPLDDISLTDLCDPDRPDMLRGRGDNPARQPEIYPGPSRAALAEKPADLVVTMHPCRDNFRSTFIISGEYQPVAVRRTMPRDSYRMEWDTGRAGGFDVAAEVWG